MATFWGNWATFNSKTWSQCHHGQYGPSTVDLTLTFSDLNHFCK